MGIPHPGKRRHHRNAYCEIGEYTHYQNRIVIVLMVNKDEDQSEDEPEEARRSAPRVYASEMLQHGGTPHAEP